MKIIRYLFEYILIIILFGLYFRKDLTYRITKYIDEANMLFKEKGYSH